MKTLEHREFGMTGLKIPEIVFGSTSLGNLFCSIPEQTKQEIVSEWLANVPAPIWIDTAGKYGAGLALEVIGRGLRQAGCRPEEVIISNKLGWRRTPLLGPEPTFEPGAWIDIDHDAVQDISYEGILRCWEEGCQLLGGYRPALISVHDPDEYLAAAKDSLDRGRRIRDIVQAYHALGELKRDGKAIAIGVGAKDWRVIRELNDLCDLDWVMFANSFTIMNHPLELLALIEKLANQGCGIINSALFHGGFLVGGDFFDYQRLDALNPIDQQRITWRNKFWKICADFGQSPFDVGLAFGRSHPAFAAVALSSSRADRVQKHVEALSTKIPDALWKRLKQDRCIDESYPYLG